MAGSEECLFCSILAGALPAQFVYENDSVVAFRDIAPVAPTHVLVVPRTHLVDATSLEASHGDLLAAMFAAASEVARREKLGGGFRLVFNVGEDAGNSVPHLHLHVIGGRSLAWPPG